jgi:hypothetical protein
VKNVAFPLPVIKDEALQKFCKEHNLFEAVAAGYHYAHKFFPKAKNIIFRFREPYYADEPEDADIIFDIESRMTVEEALEAENRFDQAMTQTSLHGIEYITTSCRFIK